MSLSVDAPTLRDLLADPAAAESLSAVADCPLVIVEVTDRSSGLALAGLDTTALTAVVVVVAREPGWLPGESCSVADVVLTEDVAASGAFTAPAGGVQAGLDALGAALAANPVAGTALVLLLRSCAGLSGPAALIAESATYSALQEGAEFHRWRSSRPASKPEPGGDRVLVERSAGVLRITLSRPDRRNAVDWRMRDALTAALAIAAREPALQVVLAGAGPDFCAGGDLDEFGSRPDPAVAHLVRLARSPALLLHQLSARTTACLHGACLGAGVELPAFASRIIASEDARFAMPELRLGLIPGAGGTVSLTHRIGRWRTAYLALTGLPIGAQDALQWGLVDAVEPPAVIDSAGMSR
jgi:enoyl-CoA hydratase/carnithine racemase